MNAARIDVSKGKSMVSVQRPFNETVAKPFEVRHTGSELKQLADYLKSLDGETRVVMEHTGRYYEQIAQYLHDAGLYVSAVNPKLIKDYGGGNSLRNVKTDKADAKKIAKYALDRWAELREHTPMDILNGLLQKRLVSFTDGTRNIKSCIDELLRFHPYTVILDWFHLKKKRQELLSTALKEKDVHNKALEKLLCIL